MPKVPKPLSLGEETLAFHLDLKKVAYRREVRLIPERQYRWDFVVGNLAIEVQGGTWRKGAHSGGLGLLRDCRKANAATLAGFRTLHFTTDQVESGEAINTILEALLRHNHQRGER